VYAITNNNVLLEFDSSNPSAVVRAVPITGLGAGETMATIDFCTSNEKLYGIPSGTRTPVYSIDRVSGAATRVGPGVPFGFPTDKATGLDYDELHGYFRYIDETFGNYRIDPTSGLQLRNDAGQEGLSEIAYKPLNGNPANFGFYGVNHITNEFMQLDPERMTVFAGGPLGVDIDPFAGLDVASDGTPYLSVNVGGVAKFGTIAADGHTFVELGTVGNGAQYSVRGIAVEPPRQAPVLDPTLSPSFGSIEEDLVNPSGLLVRDLISSDPSGDLITDPSPGALEGIAITAVNAGVGTWQFSLNGTTWTTITAVGSASALLLPADDAARVRVIPTANFNGSVANAVQFRAWDRVAGGPGARVNIADAAIVDSISAQSVWASINVLPRRDAPTITSPSPSSGSFLLDDTQTVAPFQAVTIGYIDSATLDLTVDVTISDSTHGAITDASLFVGGFHLVDAGTGTYRFVGPAAQATAAIRQLVFKPAENIAPLGDTTLSVFTIAVNDDLDIGAQALSPFIGARSVRDVPTITGAGGPIAITDKQTAQPFDQMTIADTEFGSPNLTVDVVLGAGVGVLTAESLSASGFSLIMGATGTYRFVGGPSAATAAIRQLVFRPSENVASVGVATSLAFDVVVNDGLGPAVTAKSATVDVQSANDAPTFTGLTTVNKIKFGKSIKPFRRLAIADVDPGEIVTVKITVNTPRKGSVLAASLAASGFVKIGNGRYRYVGAAAQATVAVRKLKFGWARSLNTTINQTVKLRLTITDASGAVVTNNQTAITLKK
jgi:hypothetical protein